MDIKVSFHAIQRFRERTGSRKQDELVIRKLKEMYNSAQEVFLSRIERTKALLNHNLREAKYYNYNGFILVVVENEIATIHNDEAERF